MQTYLKTKPVWMQLLLFVGMAFGIYLVLSLIGITILSRATGIGMSELQNSKDWDYTNPQMIYFMRGMLLVQFLGLFLIPSLLYAYFSDPRPMQYIGFKRPWSGAYWILGVLALIAAIVFAEFVGLLNQKIQLGDDPQKWMKSLEEQANQQIRFMLKDRNIGELLINLVFIAAFAAVGEELFFRGILQRLLIRGFKNPWGGIIVTAAVFSAIHFQFFGFFPRFVLGIILGAIYWYSGSLWTAMLAHFAYDAFLIIAVYLRPETLESPAMDMNKLIVPAIFSLAVTAFLIWQMKKRSRTSFAEVYHDDYPPPDQFRL